MKNNTDNHIFKRLEPSLDKAFANARANAKYGTSYSHYENNPHFEEIYKEDQVIDDKWKKENHEAVANEIPKSGILGKYEETMRSAPTLLSMIHDKETWNQLFNKTTGQPSVSETSLSEKREEGNTQERNEQDENGEQRSIRQDSENYEKEEEGEDSTRLTLSHEKRIYTPGNSKLELSAPEGNKPPTTDNMGDLADAQSAYLPMGQSPDYAPARLTLRDNQFDYQANEIFINNETSGEKETQNEKLQLMEQLHLLNMDWKENEHAKEKAVACFGKDFIKQYEEGDEDTKACLGGMKVLEMLYSEEGDKKYDAFDRYVDSTGRKKVVKNLQDVWKFYQTDMKYIYEEMERENKLWGGLDKKMGRFVKEVMRGRSFSESLKNIPGLNEEEKNLMDQYFNEDSPWMKSMQRARTWLVKQGFSRQITEEELERKIEEVRKNRPGKPRNYTYDKDPMEYRAVALLFDRKVPEENIPEPRTRKDLEEEAFFLLEKENTFLDISPRKLMRKLIDLKKEDKATFDALMTVYGYEMDRERNGGVVFVSPLAARISSIFESGKDFLVGEEVDYHEGDYKELIRIHSLHGLGHVYVTRDKDGKPVDRSRTRTPEEQALITEIRQIRKLREQSPDGASWLRRQVDGLGAVVGEAALSKLSLGVLTGVATANERYDEVRGKGGGVGGSFLHGAGKGLVQEGLNLICAKYAGKIAYNALAKGGARYKSLEKLSQTLNKWNGKLTHLPTTRYIAGSLRNTATGMMESMAESSLVFLMDSGIDAFSSGENGMTKEELIESIAGICSPDTIFQIGLMSSAINGKNIPEYRREAMISSASPHVIQALTRCSDKRARVLSEKLKGNAKLEDKIDLIKNEAASNNLPVGMQKRNRIRAISNMEKGMKETRALEAFQEMLETGEISHREKAGRGRWVIYDKIAGEEGSPGTVVARNVSKGEARRDLNSQLENGAGEKLHLRQIEITSEKVLNVIGKLKHENYKDMSFKKRKEIFNDIAESAGVKINKKGKYNLNEEYVLAALKSKMIKDFLSGKKTLETIKKESIGSSIEHFQKNYKGSEKWIVENARKVEAILYEKGAIKKKHFTDNLPIRPSEMASFICSMEEEKIYGRKGELPIDESLRLYLRWQETYLEEARDLVVLGEILSDMKLIGELNDEIIENIFDVPFSLTPQSDVDSKDEE